MKLGDLNLCNKISSTSYNRSQQIKFARNMQIRCAVDLQELITLQPDTKFSSLYLNYFDKQTSFVKPIPILIRNAFEVNEARALNSCLIIIN